MRRWRYEEVVYLRDLYRTGKLCMASIAAQERVHVSTVSEMLTGVYYKDVPGKVTVAERKAMDRQGFRLNAWQAAGATVIPVMEEEDARTE